MRGKMIEERKERQRKTKKANQRQERKIKEENRGR